jgi:V/A-type H+-transporting ATPase subunit I
MKRVTFLVARERSDELATALQKLGLVHFEDAVERVASEEMARERVSPEAAEGVLNEIEQVESVFNEFAPVKRRFLESLVNAPARVQVEEVRRTVHEFDIERLSQQCRRISEAVRELARSLESVETERDAVAFFARLPFELEDLRALRREGVWVGRFTEQKWSRFSADPWVQEHLAAEPLLREKRAVYACVVSLKAEQEEAQRLLKQYEFVERPVPATDKPAAERLGELEREAEELRSRLDEQRRHVADLAVSRRRVEVLKAHWTAERARVEALNSAALSRRIAVLSGFVRDRDTARLQKAMRREAPDVSLLFSDPTPQDSVPVDLQLNAIAKPMSFLVHMFGLPDYFSFDPTPYLSLSFLLFFGFCFGDVVYGLMLCALAGYLAWKARQYEGHYDLCMLFLYAGISTTIVGVLTGTWAADLWDPKYLGEGNFLLRLKERTIVVDPLDKPVLMLLVALGLGVLNQLYGVALKGYGLLRRGQVLDAVFDAGLWLLMIPAFLITSSKLFFPVPAWLFHAGVALLAVAGLALVLTQGRHEKALSAKLITGLVSLYGILGSYGCVAFLGDMLSYSRLIALGLTTSIIGMSFNIMAGLLRGVPVVGVALFVLLLVGGHVFNFAVSILGAFVHSARLIFLEFFSRFYEATGLRFRPLSLSTDRVTVVGPARQDARNT